MEEFETVAAIVGCGSISLNLLGGMVFHATEQYFIISWRSVLFVGEPEYPVQTTDLS
jgi:hypothetical protein